MNSFVRFWRRLSPAEQIVLASDVNVTRDHLARIANGSVVAGDSLIVRLLEARSEIRQTWFTQ